MLKKMYIKNFALIDKLEIEFCNGFNVLTGETGAGKSIIIDAVGIVTGNPAQAEFIRSGEEKALVEAIFDYADNEKAMKLLDEYGFVPENGEDLILTREIVRTGKNICRINGRQVNLSVYKEIAGNFVDIYGQHHQQSLLNPQKHIELVDGFGGIEVKAIKEKLYDFFYEMNGLKSKIEKLKENEKEMARMADIYKFQIEEIENCHPVPGEDVSLEEEKGILANAEKLYSLANLVYELIYDSNNQKSAVDILYDALNNMREISSIDSSLNSVQRTIEEALFQIEDAAREIRSYSEKIDNDPKRLEDIENRLDMLSRLKRKYGDTIDEILAYQAQIAAALEGIINHDEQLFTLENAFKNVNSKYQELASELSLLRKELASLVIIRITNELKDLNMPHITFDINIDRKNDPSSDGLDSIEFLISPNKGEPLKPLAKIVSGGEMSRIMLAFKSVLAEYDNVSTLIFDEVDAGIGGKSLTSVAAKLAKIGEGKQVICVTHSPQLAGYAKSHFNIRKTVEQNRTVTKVKKLSNEERIDEISRMLSGDKITDTIRNHAIEILKMSV